MTKITPKLEASILEALGSAERILRKVENAAEENDLETTADQRNKFNAVVENIVDAAHQIQMYLGEG